METDGNNLKLWMVWNLCELNENCNFWEMKQNIKILSLIGKSILISYETVAAYFR